jgi:hypothetical protein
LSGRESRARRAAAGLFGSFLLLLAAVVPAAGQAASAESAPKVERLEIVDRAIALHGGERFRHSRSALTICSKSGCFDLVATMDGDRYEYDVRDEAGVQDEGGKATRRVLASNDRVERWEQGEPVVLDGEGERRARDFANARVYFAFLPFRLNDPSVYKQDLGLERWGERELHKVRVSFAPGTSTDAEDVYLYWFDPESGRLEQFAYSFGSGDGAGVRFRELSNYRRVGGLLFFDQRNLGYEAPGVRVDVVTPDFVAQQMREVSNVTLRDIDVNPL